jgi:hypothetical protein
MIHFSLSSSVTKNDVIRLPYVSFTSIMYEFIIIGMRVGII